VTHRQAEAGGSNEPVAWSPASHSRCKVGLGMKENERAAHDLVLKLGAAGIDAHVSGAGVHWQVDIGRPEGRALLVHCFWYERAISGLILGMNPANARSRLQPARTPYEGPEYLVISSDGGRRLADGRTRDIAAVVDCARTWLAGRGLDQLALAVPFIDQKGRAMRALSRRLNPELRRDLGGDPSYELWVYGEGRSCRVQGEGDAVACNFLVGQAQVARAPAIVDVPDAVEAWLVGRLSLHDLTNRVPGLELERHAELVETDPARWHWMHLRDRAANSNDVLASLRDLIEALASSPVATKFYTYSSHDRLCFSASSHYPWVDDGLPVVARNRNGDYLVDQVRHDLRSAVHLVEATLDACPVRPFFGSSPHQELPALQKCFARQGSALHPRLVQEQAWYYLLVTDPTGARRCRMSACIVTLSDETGHLIADWPTLDDAVRAVRRYCEDGAKLAEIAARSGAHRIVSHSPTRLP
jgi:hypothetical protein